MAAASLENKMIAQRLNVSPNNVGRWRTRFCRRCGIKRNGTSTLFAALGVATGSVTGECYQKHTHKEFLKKVEGQTDKEKELHIIVDNYSTHKHEKVRNWLKRTQQPPAKAGGLV